MPYFCKKYINMKKLLLTLFSASTLLGVAQTQVDLPITFDDPNVNYDLQSFGNATDAIVTDPTDPNNTVLEQTQPVGPETWAGTTMGDAGLANPIPLTAGSLEMTVRIWSPNANVPVRLKAENSSDPTVFVEVDDTIIAASTWETLTFDFSGSAVPFDPAATYDKISVFCDFGNANKNGEVYYIDDVMLAGSGGPQMNPVDLPITFDDASVDYDLVSFGSAEDSILADPTDPANTVMQQVQPAGAMSWGGTTMGDGGLANPVPLTSSTLFMTARVWAVDSGVPILLKVEDTADPTVSVETIATTTVAGGWSDLVFNFANNEAGTPAFDPAATYDKVSIFCDFGNTAKAGEIYYVDDVEFDPTISLNEASFISDYSVSPNPSEGIVTLQGNMSNATEYTVNVLDMSGRVVFSKSNTNSVLNETIDLSNLKQGTYLINVSSKEGAQVEKLIIK
jgi:hypothetical protein